MNYQFTSELNYTFNFNFMQIVFIHIIVFKWKRNNAILKM